MKIDENKNYVKNGKISKYSLEIEISEKEIDSENDPTFAYYAGFWVSGSIFKGLKIFPGARKVHIGTFINQSSPFCKNKTKKLTLNGEGIKILVNEQNKKVQISFGTYLYGMDHTYDPNVHIIPHKLKEVDEDSSEDDEESEIDNNHSFIDYEGIMDI